MNNYRIDYNSGMTRRSHSQPIEPRRITLRLDAMTYGGDAIGRADGQAIFVTGGIAGEMVRVAITEEHRRFARARVIEVIEPSPDRVEPRCPHFGFEPTACGGCHWQHIDYAAQLRFKTQIVREPLQRLGRIADPPVRDALASPDIWAYRNHAQFSCTSDGRLGFQAARSHRVVPIEVCHIVQPPILDWLQTNRRAGEPASSRISVRASSPQLPISNVELPTSHFQIKDATFQVSADSFFQVNTSLIETLIDQVMSKLDLHGNETVLDAYCGVGLFSHFVAPQADRVIGIELTASAIADARINLAAFNRVTLHEGRVEQVLPTIETPINAAVVDPPRAGCGPLVMQTLIDRKIDRMVIVSCDPSTLARDVRFMIDRGYRLIEAQPLDMFPHTYHVEVVALLLRADHAIL